MARGRPIGLCLNDVRIILIFSLPMTGSDLVQSTGSWQEYVMQGGYTCSWPPPATGSLTCLSGLILRPARFNETNILRDLWPSQMIDIENPEMDILPELLPINHF